MTRAKQVTEERRRHARFALTGDFPARLTTLAGELLEVVPVDISEQGLGLLVDPGPKTGERLRLEFAGEAAIEVVVRWSSALPDMTDALPDLDGVRRVGLMVVGQGMSPNLVERMSAFDAIQLEE